MTTNTPADSATFAYVVCKEVPGRSLTLGKDLVIDQSDSMDDALCKMKTFLSERASHILWSAG